MGGGEAQVQSKALVGLKLSAIGDQTQQRPTSESSRSHWLRLNGIRRRYPPFKTEDQLFLQKKKSNESGNLLGTKRRRGIILPSRHCGGKVLAPVHYLSGGLQAGGCKCLLVSATG